VDRRRDKGSGGGAVVWRVDPVLAGPELTRRLVVPSDIAEEDPVHLSDQPERDREVVILEPPDTVL
jgi:hypothetical protein